MTKKRILLAPAVAGIIALTGCYDIRVTGTTHDAMGGVVKASSVGNGQSGYNGVRAIVNCRNWLTGAVYQAVGSWADGTTGAGGDGAGHYASVATCGAGDHTSDNVTGYQTRNR